MAIEVVRLGRVIADCQTVWHPNLRRFGFTIPIEDRFTGRDLITEEVMLVARDNKGNTGRLVLDGADGLELIRDHLGASCITIIDLDFSSGGSARPFLQAGWWPQRDSTWAIDDESVLTFDAPAEPGTYALRFTAGSFIRKPKLTQQVLEVLLNGAEIARFVFTERHDQSQETKFPSEAFSGGGRAILRLRHPDAARPADIMDSPDTRRLAFTFKRLSIVRFLDEESERGAVEKPSL